MVILICRKSRVPSYTEARLDWLTFISTVINSDSRGDGRRHRACGVRSDIAALLGKLGSRLQTAKGAGV